MSRDLDYFTDFLANPSAVSFNEFWRMVREWADYIAEHKGEFNYLADEEWREIRERLLDDFQRREPDVDAAQDEWEDLCDEFDSEENRTDAESIALFSRQLNLMKTCQYYFKFTDEMIAQTETMLANFIESVKKAELAEMELAQSRKIFEDSVAEFDDALVEHYERTGKIPVVPSYNGKKKHDGN